MKIGLIGFGNMAQALVQGWITADQPVDPSVICACAAHYDQLVQKAQSLKILPCRDAADVCRQADVVVIAVKPDKVETALSGCASILKERQNMIVCVAAGWNNSRLEALLPETRHICVMPNTPVCVQQGIIVAQKENTLSEEQLNDFKVLFEKIAMVVMEDEVHFGIAGDLAGCAPAFADLFMEALADAAVCYGLPRTQAYELSAKVLEGAGALYFYQHQHPGALKDAVCSPGGLTIQGVCALEANGFRNALIQAVAAIEKKRIG